MTFRIGAAASGILPLVTRSVIENDRLFRCHSLSARSGYHKEAWIERVIASPEARSVQTDRRVRLWGPVPEYEGRHLRVILLADGQTVHNAFFDRGFKP